MDPISKLGDVLGLLRRRRASRHPARGAAAGAAGKDRTAPSSSSPPPLDPPALTEAVSTQVRLRLHGVQGLSWDADDTRDRALAVFVEEVLLGHFGKAAWSPAHLRDMAQRVIQAMQADAQVRADLDALLSRLWEEAEREKGRGPA